MGIAYWLCMSKPRLVLVVEDDRNVQQSVRRAVERAGVQVAIAGSLAEAHALLARVSRPCLVLLDFLMRGAREVVAQLGARVRLAAIPVRVSATNVRRMSKKAAELDELQALIDEHCAPEGDG
jgi:CheY-like chemotaxis protein